MFRKLLGALAAIGLGYLAHRAVKAKKGSNKSSGGDHASAANAIDVKSAAAGTGTGGSGSGGTPLPATNYTGWAQDRAYDLKGKVAFVTGGGGGIGRGIVEVLARCGCDVAIVDVNQIEAERVAGIVRSNGRRALVLKADVRSLTEMETAAAECVSKLGGLDICIANAGIVRTGSILTMDEKRWHEIMDVNMTGTFLTVRACSREMVKQNRRIDSPASHHSSSGVGGRIITISSANAVLAGAEGGAYCATKAGVAIMTRCWAQDLIAHDITVNCIGPGATDTGLMRAQVDSVEAHTGLLKLIPSGRMAEPEEVGWLCAFYASPAAAYLTGNFTLMDGGLRDHNAELTPALHETRALRAKLTGPQVLAKIDADAKAAHDVWMVQREKFALK